MKYHPFSDGSASWLKLHIGRNLKVLPGFVLKLSFTAEAILISHSQSAHLERGKPQLLVYLC